MRKALKTIIFIICTLLSFYSNAQTDTVYFNKKWKKTEKDSASYYRTVDKQTDGRFFVKDHYLNGKVQMSGYYTCADFDSTCKNGDFIYYDSLGFVTNNGSYKKGKRMGVWKHYYKNSGVLKSSLNYINDTFYKSIFYDSITHNKLSEGNFINHKRDSVWLFYNPNTSNIQSVISFHNGLKEGSAIFYDSITHNIKEQGAFLNNEATGEWKYYSRGGHLASTLNYKDNMLEGTANYYDTALEKNAVGYIRGEATFLHNKLNGLRKGYYPGSDTPHVIVNYIDNKIEHLTSYYKDGKIKGEEKYNNDKLLSGVCFDEDGGKIRFTPFYVMPIPTVDISDYLKQHLLYPYEARRNNVEGRVIVKFIVDEQGQIDNVTLAHGIGSGCDEEAIRVVSEMPNWEPGTEDGKPYKVSYTLPISFKLQ